jgi:hypothetical protein
MGKERPHRHCVIAVVCAGFVTLVVVAWLRHDPYAGRKGFVAVPEFVGQPLSFARSRLGEPTRAFEFTVAEGVEAETIRRMLGHHQPPLAPDTRVREVSWDKDTSFVTVWYRSEGGREFGIDAAQWDKRLPGAAEMATSPAKARETSP